MNLIWGSRARRDFHELISYIAEESIRTAELVSNRIENATEVLRTMPRSGRPGRVAGTREHPVPRTPYILVYRVNPSGVLSLRIYRAARRWPERFD